MRRLGRFLLLGLLLAACAPLEQTPPAYPPAQAGPGVLVLRDASGRILLNPSIGLPAPAGSLLLSQSYLGEASKSRFRSPDSFDRVVLWLKRELLDLGWTIVEAEVKERPPAEYRARLLIRKGKQTREIRLRYQDGVFDLEVGDAPSARTRGRAAAMMKG